MKRFAAFLLIFALLLSGCGGQEPEPEETELLVVGVSQLGAESDWRVANSESMKAVFTEEKGYRLLFENARQIQENQIIAVRKFIQQQVDYIVLMPLSESGWESVLEEARDAGIPVILADRMVDVEDETLYTAHVGSDTYAEGMRAIAWMEQKYSRRKDTVEIIHIQGTLGSTAQLGRTKALTEGVEANENWQILTCLDGDFTQAKSYEVMCEYLDTLPDGQDIDVVYCENDNEAFGAIEALEQRGYACGRDVDVICFDGTRNALQLCLEGKISLAVECNPLLGPMVEDVITQIEAGKIPEKRQVVQEQIFTKATLTEEIIAQREY